MTGELYHLQNIRRVFGRREVVSIDSLGLEAGCIYGLLGPNGSGKSTLMKLLAFLDEPDGGTIFFKGREAARKDMAAFRSSVVWSPQFPVMFSGSLRYNIEYPMRLKGVAAHERRRRADELLERVKLASLAEATARRLSGGEAQRASLARALAAGAEVLLLDEPTANVDIAAREGLVRLIEELWRDRGLSIIVATHDHSVEAELCQKLIHLRDGHLFSVDDAALYAADLCCDEGRFYVGLPPGAGIDNGVLAVEEIRGADGGVIVKLRAENHRAISVKIEGEAGTRLCLKDVLRVRRPSGQ
jgi:ABC-type multidrug transport system ATPase subunit